MPKPLSQLIGLILILISLRAAEYLPPYAASLVDTLPAHLLYMIVWLAAAIPLVLQDLLLLIQTLIIIAFATLTERKTMGDIQRRFGPNVVGYAGLLQPLADGLKLFLKEPIIPRKANHILFLAAPMLVLTLALYSWYLIPLSQHSYSDLHLGLLYVLVVNVLEIYGIVFAGWSSNSKYALLGGLRSTAQMISYEIALSFIFLNIVLFATSFNLSDFVVLQQLTLWNCLPLLPVTLIFLISMLAETNRTPFDLPEGESELVAGFHVEYAGMLFAFFFLGEYSNMLFLSALFSILFLGGWLVGPFFLLQSFLAGLAIGLKMVSLLFFFIWVRATFPRLRYDQLMDLGWKIFLPIAFSYFVFVFFWLYNCHSLPQPHDVFGEWRVLFS
jgi:NADH-quinone oxidoreductase subunit H